MSNLTPVEDRNGRLYKREDLHRDPSGVNGSKFRACRYLMKKAKAEGARHVFSAQSVLSPQAAMAGVLANELELDCTLVFGSTTPESAVKHVSPRIGAEHGARIDANKKRVGYNAAIQKAARELAENTAGGWQLPYAISQPDEAGRKEVEAFLRVGGAQVRNLPHQTRTLVMTLGSGNTAAGVLYGLATVGPPRDLERVVLVGVGKDKCWPWMTSRLDTAGAALEDQPFQVEFWPLSNIYSYQDRVKVETDGIVLHPTYEGKLAHVLNLARPNWWTGRDGTTCLWIVGGPF